MKNIIKAVITFATIITFSSANAGVLEVTGTAKATYVVSGGQLNDNGKALGITNELAFTGTGELDNGYTWKYQVELDDNSSGATTSDDTRLEVTTPYGVIAAYNTEGGLSTKYKFSQAAYGAGSDNGAGGNMQYGAAIDGYNNIQYHTPAGLLPFKIVGKVGYSPSSDAGKNSGNSTGSTDGAKNGDNVIQYQITAEPADGITLGASYLDKDAKGTVQGYETGGYFGTYTVGAFSFGAGQHFVANYSNGLTDHEPSTTLNTAALLATVKSYENKAASIGYAFNDNISLSFEREYSTANKRSAQLDGIDHDNGVTLEIETAQAAYTMGGMTMSLSRKALENVDYTAHKSANETLFAVAMAF
jgi:hypothetical protein